MIGGVVPRYLWRQDNFSSGIVSPAFRERPTDRVYQRGVADALNYLVTRDGALEQRPQLRAVVRDLNKRMESRIEKIGVNSSVDRDDFLLLLQRDELGDNDPGFKAGSPEFDLVAAWATGQNYVEGNERTNDGVVWEAQSDHLSAAGNEPTRSNVPAQWALKLAPNRLYLRVFLGDVELFQVNFGVPQIFPLDEVGVFQHDRSVLVTHNAFVARELVRS